MNIEDIKYGESYHVTGHIGYKNDDVVGVTFFNKFGVQTSIEFEHKYACGLISMIPEQPKHDPCRRYKKGDIVRLREYNGRKPYDFWHKQTIERFGAKLDTVLEDELDSGNVDIFQDAPIDEQTVRVHASHLELVTPVEELEPYYVGDCQDDPDCPFFFIQNNANEISDGLLEEVARYVYGTDYTADKETVRKRAEAERDRLNAEYRKEHP